jgi:hypothetical protein
MVFYSRLSVRCSGCGCGSHVPRVPADQALAVLLRLKERGRLIRRHGGKEGGGFVVYLGRRERRDILLLLLTAITTLPTAAGIRAE